MKKRIAEVFQITLIIAVLGAIGHACKKNRFKKEDFLSNLYSEKAKPEIDNTLNEINNLTTAWSTYSTSISTENFEAVRNQLTNVANLLEKINFYNLGDVGSAYVFSRFYKSTIDTTGIIDLYEASETFSSNDISTYNNTQKGIFTLEYLLYSLHFESDRTSDRYIQFLTAQINYLSEAITEFQNAWVIYSTKFIENEGSGVSDSYNIVVNRIIHTLEDIIIKRIEKPSEFDDLTISVGYYSNQAIQKIKTKVKHLEEVYNGRGISDFNSVYNNVRKKNKKLADQINEKFNEVIATGESLAEELAFYILTDEASLDTYKSELVELLTFFKVDVKEELDIIITFGDTDGD